MKLVSLQIIFLLMTAHSTLECGEQETKTATLTARNELVAKLKTLKKTPRLYAIMCNKLYPSPYVQEINICVYNFFELTPRQYHGTNKGIRNRLSVADGLKILRDMDLLDRDNRVPKEIESTARATIYPPSATEQDNHPY